MAGASGPTLPRWPVAMWRCLAPPCPHPRQRSVGWLLHCLTSVHFMSVQAMDEICSPWIHGPIVIHLEAINRLWNCHLDQIFARAGKGTDFGGQSRLNDAMAVHRRAGRRPHHAARRPRHLHRLSTTYKYPLAP